MLQQKALLISLEGIDGAGKSTQIKRLCTFLSAHNLSYACYREPGDTVLGEKVRAILKSPDPNLHIDPLAELLLFSAARVELINSKIKPALAAGKIVILDRFVDSTLAYQGGGRALPYELVETVCNLVLQGLNTDRTYYLRLPRKLALERLQTSRKLTHDRLDNINDNVFWENITQVYDKLAKVLKDGQRRFCVIDASLHPDNVHKNIVEDLQQLLSS